MKGQIIYVRRARLITRENKFDIFLITKSTRQNRCIILSDEAEILKQNRYWYKSSKDDRFDGILIADLKNSVIGDEIRSPRKIFTSKMHLTRVHRNMKSLVPLHKIVCLAIQIKQNRKNDLIAAVISSKHR